MGVMNLAQIMDKSIDILKRYLKTIALFIIGFGVVAFIAIIIIAIFSGVFFGISSMAYEGSSVAFFFFGFIVLLVGSFVGASKIGIIKIASQEFLDEKVYTDIAFKQSFKSIFKVFGLFAIILVLYIPVIILFYVVFKGYTNIETFINQFKSAGTGEIVGFILLALIISFITLVFINVFAFSLHVIAIEGKGPIGAIKRSYELVKGNYFKVLGCFILFYLIVFALKASFGGLLALISGIIYGIMRFLNFQQSYLDLVQVSAVYLNWPINLISWLIITPISSIMMTLLYFNQRFKKEGFDLKLRLKEIQKNEERKQLSEAVESNNSF